MISPRTLHNPSKIGAFLIAGASQAYLFYQFNQPLLIKKLFQQLIVYT